MTDNQIHELVTEQPYSDSGCITKGWTGRFDWISDWKEWTLDFDLHFLGHSKNWCMGSLNIDPFFFSLEIGPIDLFVAYRMVVKPPKTVIIGDIHARALQGDLIDRGPNRNYRYEDFN